MVFPYFDWWCFHILIDGVFHFLTGGVSLYVAEKASQPSVNSHVKLGSLYSHLFVKLM